MRRGVLPGLALVVAVLAMLVAARTARVSTRAAAVAPASLVPVDVAGAADRLAGALRFRTVSHQEPGRFEADQFAAFHDYLADAYPRIHGALTRDTVGGQALLYRWPGADPDLPPLLLLAHMDVVPVESGSEGHWTHPPFGGRVADGFVWGRGALDDKAAMVGILEAVESLLAGGFQPGRTILLAFGHDEEVGGERGAAGIAALLEERGVRPFLVLDEGGIISEGLLDGLDASVAVVGIAEKGYASIELSVRAEGGHSSQPPRQTAVGILATAIHNLERHPLPADLNGTARRLFEAIAPELSWPTRALVANLWLFGPLVERRLSATPTTDAMLRTTTAATMIQGSDKENVLPIRARAVVNFRILPGDSVAGVLEHVRRVVDDARVEIRVIGTAAEPSPVADPDGPAFRLVEWTIREVFPDVVVAPYLVLGATDARHYGRLTPDVLRFAPFRIGQEDIDGFHGTDERIGVEDFARGVQFYAHLIRNGGGS